MKQILIRSLWIAGVLLLPALLSPQAISKDQTNSDRIVECVAKIMNLEKPTLMPSVIYLPQPDIEQIGRMSAGVRARSGAPIGLYFPPNLIMMSVAARPDDLVHEIAHHFQHHHKKPILGEEAEREAEFVRRAALSNGCL